MSISCPNKRLVAWKNLVKNVGENKAYVLWTEYNGNVPNSYYKNNIQFEEVKTDNNKLENKIDFNDLIGSKKNELESDILNKEKEYRGRREDIGDYKEHALFSGQQYRIFTPKGIYFKFLNEDGTFRYIFRPDNTVNDRTISKFQYESNIKESLVEEDIDPIESGNRPYEEQNNSILFNNKRGKFTIDEILENILNNYKNLSPIGKELLEKSRRLVGKTGAKFEIVDKSEFSKTALMHIKTKTNTIQVSRDIINTRNIETVIRGILHEISHAQTIEALKNPQSFDEHQFNDNVEKYFKFYKDKKISLDSTLTSLKNTIENLKSESEKTGNDHSDIIEDFEKKLKSLMKYGFTNKLEFVAEIYVNKEFRQELKNLDKENNTSYFKKFINLIKNFIRRKIGLAKTKESDLLIEKIIDFVESDKRHYTGLNSQDLIFEKRIEDDSKYSSLQSKLANIIDKAKTKTQSIQDRTIKSNNKNSTPSKEEHILRNKELLETLDKYEKSQKWKAVIGYAQSFDKTINHVNSLLDNLLETKNIYEDKLDDLLKRYKDYLSAYDLLPEIKELMSQADLKQFELTEEELEDYKQLKDFLSEASKKHDSIESKFLAISKAQVLQDFSNPMYNTEVETKQRDELLKEYNQLSDKQGLSADQYISKMLATRDLADYKADLKASAEKILNDPSKDITMMSQKLEDPLNIKSKTIQIVNQIYAESFDKVKTLVISKIHQMGKTFDKFVAEKGNKKLSELNKNLIEKDSEGQVYLKGKYSIKFKESFTKLLNDIEDSYENSFKKLQVQDINLDSLRKDKKTISLRKSGEHNFIDNDIAVVTVNGINTGIKVQIDQIKTFNNFNSLSDERKNDFAKAVGNYKDFEDFKNSNDYAKEDSKKSQMYPEIYNFINNSGSMDIISYVKVEEDSKTSTTFKNRNKMYKAWFKENTIKNEKGKTIPHPKFLNKELTGIEKEVLDSYKKIDKDNDQIEGFDSLVTTLMGAEFHKLPSKSKSDLERVLETDVKGLTKDKWTDLTKIKSDDIGIDSGSEEKNSQGDIIRRVKTAYRGQIDPKEQSLDLETMYRNEYWNGQNFKEKTAIEPKLLLVTDIAKSNTYYTGKSKIEVKGELSNTYKKLVGMMERNVYDIYSTHGGTFGSADINKITNALNGYAAGLAMTFNLASGTVNIANGLTQVFTEAVGGHRFDVETFAKAELKYNKEMMNGNLLKDMGRSVKTSYFNQLLEMFDVFGGLGQNEQDALRNNIIRKLGSRKTGNFINESGEHMMHSILTQSILDGIKAMDENNNYLDKDGNITTEDKGASLADMLYFDEHGQLQMNSKVAYSGFNLTTKYHEGGKSQIKLLIKAKVFQLFGVYDIKYKNEISKAWWGKSVMMFKNFFLVAAAYRYTGFTTSYKKKSDLTDDDRFYNSAEKEYIEGTYTTLIRFLRETGVPNLQMLQTMYMNYDNLTEYEKANLKKATLEIMFTMVILPSIGLLLGAAGGDDKDNKLLWFAMYTNRRLTQELAQFRNPIEATRMIQNPVAGIRFIQNGLNFIYDVATPINLVPGKGESVFGYLDENSKGQNKMSKHLSKLIPIIPQVGINYKQRYGLEFGKQN